MEIIYFGALRSADNSVIHHGDNLTGIGDGDDEVIEILLNKINPSVKYIWAVITIYTDGKTFFDVKGAFCRLFDKNSNKEFCRFNLSENLDQISNGCIMCSIAKFSSNWGIQSRGYYTKGT